MPFVFSRAVLLTGAALFALSAAPAAAQQPGVTNAGAHSKVHRLSQRGTDRSVQVLYDQSDNDSGFGIVSQNFTDNPIYSAAAADDFVVPAGSKWTVTEIDVAGAYFDGTGGPADSENVIFWADKKGKVGKVVAEFDNVLGIDDKFGNFIIPLGPKGAKLKAGHYWVSVVANMAFDPNGEWAWENQTTTEGDAAVWENPQDGFGTGCTTWTVESQCAPTEGDHVFVLKGKAK
jgi:hypothetical protein